MLLPFARQFYGTESSYVWTDDVGAEHEVLQASKATSCLHFMQSPSTPPFMPLRPHCSQAWACLRSSTSSARRSVSPSSTRQPRRCRRCQDVLLERIPAFSDLQSAWLLLLFCASTRANYLLRMLPPHCTADYSRDHDRAVALCLRTLVYGEDAPALPDDALATAQVCGQPLLVLLPLTGPRGRMPSLPYSPR